MSKQQEVWIIEWSDIEEEDGWTSFRWTTQIEYESVARGIAAALEATKDGFHYRAMRYIAKS